MTISATGFYFVFGRVTIAKDSGDNTLTQAVIRLVTDVGGGFTEVQGSRGNIYSDGSLQGNTATFQMIKNFLAGTVLKLQATLWDGDAFSTVSGGSSLILVRSNTTSMSAPSSSLVVFGSRAQIEESIGLTTNSSESWVQKVELATAFISAGTYRIGIFYNWSHSSVSTEFQARVQINDTDTIYEHNEEPGAAATDAYHVATGVKWVTLAAGVHLIDLDFRSNSGGDTAAIRNARLEFWRIS